MASPPSPQRNAGEQESIIYRAALGRTATLGDLYNAYEDDFCAGANIFNKPLTQEQFEEKSNTHTKFNWENSDSLSERCKLWNIGGELKLSVYALSVGVSGSYLKEESKSARKSSFTFVFQKQTKVQKFNVLSNDINELLIDSKKLLTTTATHFVTQVDYGVNAAMEMSFESRSKEDRKEWGGKLKASMGMVQKMVEGSVGAKVNNKKKKTEDFLETKIKFFSDMEGKDRIPETVEDFIEFARDINSKTGNEGKGRPISYGLFPIAALDLGFNELTERALKRIDEESVVQVSQLLDDLQSERKKLYDLWNDVNENQVLFDDSTQKTVEEMKLKVERGESKLRGRLGECLKAVRMGKMTVKELNEILADPSNIQPSEIRKFREALSFANDKLDYLGEWRRMNVAVISKARALEKAICVGEHYVLFANICGEEALDVRNRVLFDRLCREMSSAKPSADDAAEEVSETGSQKSKANFTCHVVDLDLYDSSDKPKVSTVRKYADGHCVDDDLVGRLVRFDRSSSNVIKFTNTAQVALWNSSKCTPLNVECPLSEKRGRCVRKKYEWICYDCEKPLLMDIGGSLYCDCGVSSMGSATFRCGHSQHGDIFIPLSEEATQLNVYGKEPLCDKMRSELSFFEKEAEKALLHCVDDSSSNISHFAYIVPPLAVSSLTGSELQVKQKIHDLLVYTVNERRCTFQNMDTDGVVEFLVSKGVNTAKLILEYGLVTWAWLRAIRKLGIPIYTRQEDLDVAVKHGEHYVLNVGNRVTRELNLALSFFWTFEGLKELKATFPLVGLNTVTILTHSHVLLDLENDDRAARLKLFVDGECVMVTSLNEWIGQ